MTPRMRRGIATGLAGALGFTAGLFVGMTRERSTPPPPLTQTFLPYYRDGTYDLGGTTPRVVGPPPLGWTCRRRFITRPCSDGWRYREGPWALKRRADVDELERRYRANLAREGLTPRTTHEPR